LLISSDNKTDEYAKAIFLILDQFTQMSSKKVTVFNVNVNVNQIFI